MLDGRVALRMQNPSRGALSSEGNGSEAGSGEWGRVVIEGATKVTVEEAGAKLPDTRPGQRTAWLEQILRSTASAGFAICLPTQARDVGPGAFKTEFAARCNEQVRLD